MAKSSGGSKADAFIKLGDLLHKNFNSTMNIAGQNKRAAERNAILLKELEAQKEQFGLEFALKRLQGMAEISALEKQSLMAELSGRAEVQSNFLDMQAKDISIREKLDSKERRAGVARGWAKGFGKTIKNQGRSGTEQPQQSQSAPLLSNQKAPVPIQPQQNQNTALLSA